MRQLRRRQRRRVRLVRSLRKTVMAQTKQQIQAHLAGAGAQPRHKFGQNFMIDQNLVRLIADAASITSEDTLIEVGPGTGTLTEELLSRGARVVAVEIDRDLAAHLRGLFEGNAEFVLIEGDALATKHSINAELLANLDQAGDRSHVKLVANLPYNIASPLVIELLLAGVSTLVFTVQKEVADRLKGRADSDDYGPLTVMAQMLGEVEVLRTLPPQAFWPAPKIESSLVRITLKNQLGESARAFGFFVQKLFSFRRKTLRKALEMMDLKAPESLVEAGIDLTKRAECFTPQQIRQIFESCSARSSSPE